MCPGAMLIRPTRESQINTQISFRNNVKNTVNQRQFQCNWTLEVLSHHNATKSEADSL